MLIFYNILSYILIPLIKINLLIRIINRKEDKTRYLERYGITSKKKPHGKILWIHATSIGEFKSADILINNLHKKYNILITTTTMSAANYAAKKYKNKIIHQYAPLDVKIWVQRFLDKWRPNICIWIESDLWPITLHLINQKSIKSILLNLRISPKSMRRWLFFKTIYARMLDSFDFIFAQSLIDKERIEKIYQKKISYIGNLKLASIDNNITKDFDEKLVAKYKKFRFFLMASTHKNEEVLFIDFIKNVTNKIDDLKIIIAPRHSERSNSITKMLKKYKIKSNIINKEIDSINEKVIIVNTLGDMPFYFSISDIVFLGGSFVNMGGHNPIEPANNNCVILSGPHIYNWENIFLDMKNINACKICRDVKEIEKFFEKIYNNPTEMNKFKKNAINFANKKFFESQELFTTINNIIENYKNA